MVHIVKSGKIQIGFTELNLDGRIIGQKELCVKKNGPIAVATILWAVLE